VLARPPAERLEAMARFRRLRVDVYGEVDDRRVHEFLRSDLADRESLVRAIRDRFSLPGEEP